MRVGRDKVVFDKVLKKRERFTNGPGKRTFSVSLLRISIPGLILTTHWPVISTCCPMRKTYFRVHLMAARTFGFSLNIWTALSSVFEVICGVGQYVCVLVCMNVKSTLSELSVNGNRVKWRRHVRFLFAEFREERRILLEVIGPELQSIYDDRQIEVSLFVLYLFVSRVNRRLRFSSNVTLESHLMWMFWIALHIYRLNSLTCTLEPDRTERWSTMIRMCCKIICAKSKCAVRCRKVCFL